MPIKCKQCGHLENGGRTIIHAQNCPKYAPPAWESTRRIAEYNARAGSPECIALFPHHGQELWKPAPELAPIINTLRVAPE